MTGRAEITPQQYHRANSCSDDVTGRSFLRNCYMTLHILKLGMWGRERKGLLCKGDLLGAEVTPAWASLTEGIQPSTGRQSQVPIMGPLTAPEQ